MAYCLHFVHNCLTREDQRTRVLTVLELRAALMACIKMVQYAFAEDKRLVNNRLCSQTLCKLNPFIDSAGILRAGGKLSHSGRTYHILNPIILLNKHAFTKLLIVYYHIVYFHHNPRVLKVLHHFLACFHANPTPSCPAMGELPAPHVQQVSSFNLTGLDYGPTLVCLYVWQIRCFILNLFLLHIITTFPDWVIQLTSTVIMGAILFGSMTIGHTDSLNTIL
ncbi:hypothetical protein PR048_024330 [Dryococelus australis]|uniref:Uncharacterized protein n=1 Tax=Dryococelus australis TaxID=614101 RepID=A0ABQ9GNA4_9NEOP|nr:hypothetical protein PR048_024330 [Dryococelus australis]